MVRIIPARAGFTDVSPDLMIESADHPRSRGVYQQYVLLIHWNRGSSPLARGLRIACERLRIGIGIIPARAGFTPGSGRPLRHQGDHPRSRGVYRRATGLPPAPHGSSPLARGLRALGFHPDSWVRIIPARAGFTKLDLVKILVVVDHPRSRGVYDGLTIEVDPAAGSSPLARGLPLCSSQHSCATGIIPARAGFTTGVSPSPTTRWDHPRSRGVYLHRGSP